MLTPDELADLETTLEKALDGEGRGTVIQILRTIRDLRGELLVAEAAVVWLAENASHSMRGPYGDTIDRICSKHATA